MILEIAMLPVRPGHADEFEAAFSQAQAIISRAPGFCGLELQRCVEHPDRYVLLVRWRSVEDHTVGFRQSSDYQRWKTLLHHFYDPFPSVEHYTSVFTVEDPASSLA